MGSESSGGNWLQSNFLLWKCPISFSSTSPPPTVCRIALIRCCSHTLSELSETGCALPGNVFPAQVPARAAEQAASPVEEAGVISQEQEEHRGGKHRHTGEPLKPRHVSRCSLCALCLSDFGPHSQPFFFFFFFFLWRPIFSAGWSSKPFFLCWFRGTVCVPWSSFSFFFFFFFHEQDILSAGRSSKPCSLGWLRCMFGVTWT